MRKVPKIINKPHYAAFSESLSLSAALSHTRATAVPGFASVTIDLDNPENQCDCRDFVEHGGRVAAR
jgi:hypothetical protein